MEQVSTGIILADIETPRRLPSADHGFLGFPNMHIPVPPLDGLRAEEDDVRRIAMHGIAPFHQSFFFDQMTVECRRCWGLHHCLSSEPVDQTGQAYAPFDQMDGRKLDVRNHPTLPLDSNRVLYFQLSDNPPMFQTGGIQPWHTLCPYYVFIL